MWRKFCFFFCYCSIILLPCVMFWKYIWLGYKQVYVSLQQQSTSHMSFFCQQNCTENIKQQGKESAWPEMLGPLFLEGIHMFEWKRTFHCNLTSKKTKFTEIYFGFVFEEEHIRNSQNSSLLYFPDTSFKIKKNEFIFWLF